MWVSALGGQKTGLVPLKLKLQAYVSCHMGPGAEQNSGPLEEQQKLLSHLTSPIELGQATSKTLELRIVKIITNWALFCLIVLILNVLFRIWVAELHCNYFIVLTEFKSGFVEIPVLQYRGYARSVHTVNWFEYKLFKIRNINFSMNIN